MIPAISYYKSLKFLLFLFFFISPICGYSVEKVPTILVSVAPHKFFVEKIAGATVEVELMVPVAASAHTFEPTPKQVLRASQADIWFRIGEGFESRAIKALSSHNPNLVIIDLRNNVDMIATDPHSGCHCCHANSQDLHFWLSARQAKIQAKTIADALISRYPLHKEQYQTALESFLHELDALDKEIVEALSTMKNRTIFVSHPAYAYFCRDYGLNQLSIELDGKDPTPQQLTKILYQARDIQTKKIFIQMQYSNKGAKLFAKELGAELVMLEPYAENIIKSLRTIAQNFATQ